MHKLYKMWKAEIMPNGVWEVTEHTFWGDIHSYRTIVRGLTQEQAKAIAKEHQESINGLQ